MKILHIEAGRHIYGGAFQVEMLLEGLSKAGVENILVCPKGSDIATHAAPFATVEAIPMAGDVDLLFPFRLCRLLKTHRPDVVHVHSRRGADVWGGLCASWMGIPSIPTRRVSFREWAPLLRFKCKYYTQLIGISDGTIECMVEAGVPRERIRRIYSVVPAADYEGPRDRPWFKREFGVAESAPVIGVLAQLIESKGHRYVIEAAPRLAKDVPGLRILFLGKGAYRETLEKQVADAEMGEVILFTGFRDDMRKILPCLDLVILPSLMEGLGVALLQASAAGIPVIGARVGGIPEIARDGVNGLVVEPRDAEGIYHAAAKILLNPDLAKRFSDGGKKLVREVFAPEAMVKGYLEEYGKLNKK